MKAIETRYNGHRFRSRLEARWAVFFDELGIEWEYEPEGFELQDGTRYLPDFYLPKFEGGCWVEIKPKYGDWRKAAAFCFESNQPVWLADGNPGERSYTLLRRRDASAPDRDFMNPSCDPSNDGDLELHIYFDLSWGCVPLANKAQGENRMYTCADVEASAHGWDIGAWIDWNAENVAAARNFARSARFEFGESGAG
jgi:hypothetical protein